MTAVIDLTGHVYGRLTVLQRAGSVRAKSRWRCRCACGKRVYADSNSLREGHTTSCGCRKREVAAEALRKTAFRHGHSTAGNRSREYKAWSLIVQRCTNPNRDTYKRYGAAGVKVHAAWRKSFARFLADVGPAPSQQHTIDRIKNSRGYQPGNVKWATNKEQQRNRTNNRLVRVGNVSLPIVVWAERSGISKDAIRLRLEAGWPPRRAVTQPARKHVRRR